MNLKMSEKVMRKKWIRYLSVCVEIKRNFGDGIENNGEVSKMNRKIEKLVRNYWSISKIVGVLFTLWNYGMWTEPFNIVKAVLIIIGVSVGTFIVINALDIVVGLIKKSCEAAKRYMHDKRLLKAFYMTNNEE